MSDEERVEARILCYVFCPPPSAEHGRYARLGLQECRSPPPQSPRAPYFDIATAVRFEVPGLSGLAAPQMRNGYQWHNP